MTTQGQTNMEKQAETKKLRISLEVQTNKEFDDRENKEKPTRDQEEAKVLIDLFDAYDKEKSGKIKVENLYEIGGLMGKNNENVDDILNMFGKSREDFITLQEYQNIVQQLEKPEPSSLMGSEVSVESKKVLITPDSKKINDVFTKLRLLQAFQKKCEKEGKYGEAKLAQQKMDEIKLKEILRQENNIRALQEEELAHLEKAQKEQFEEFSKIWENYMQEYETKALDSLEKLKVKIHFAYYVTKTKEKHIKEVEELNEKLKKDLAFSFKSSKQLIELRQKESALVKMKKYSEAEKVKMQADALEELERMNKEKEIEEIIDKKTQALRNQQQRGLAVLLKRIQKDRELQIKNRDTDQQKLVLKNKNLRNELISRHAVETRNALEVVRNNLSLINSIYLTKSPPKSPKSSIGTRNIISNTFRKDSFSKVAGQTQRI